MGSAMLCAPAGRPKALLGPNWMVKGLLGARGSLVGEPDRVAEVCRDLLPKVRVLVGTENVQSMDVGGSDIREAITSLRGSRPYALCSSWLRLVEGRGTSGWTGPSLKPLR